MTLIIENLTLAYIISHNPLKGVIGMSMVHEGSCIIHAWSPPIHLATTLDDGQEH